MKGKALHYQSESALSYSDSGFSKGNRLSVHEENAEKQLLNQRKNDKVAEKSSKDFNSQDKRPINGPTVDGLVFTRVNSTIQYGKLVIHRTPDERYYG